MDKLVTPLLHIGYHKTGSSWLQKHVFSQPGLGFQQLLSRQQLLTHFVRISPLRFNLSTCQQTLQPAIDQFDLDKACPVLSHERLSGNPHSGGFDCTIIAKRLHQVFPQGKVLIIIREQKQMVLSTYKQYVKMGGTDNAENYVAMPAYVKFPFFQLEQFEYHRLIQYYFSLFGQKQVLVMPFEQFKQQPLLFIKTILAFCQIELPEHTLNNLPFHHQENKAFSGLTTSLKRQSNQIIGPRNHPYLQPKISLKNRHPYHSQRFWQRVDQIIPAKLKAQSDMRLSNCLNRIVADYYKKSNRLTADLLQLDLEAYGYDL